MADDSGRDLVGIRRVSELTGPSIDTLRWYEREGLLPLVERGPGGRRLYPPAAVGFVRLVQALRRTGMPVGEVRSFVQMGSGMQWHDRRAALLESHAAGIERRILQLQQDLTLVRDKITHHHRLRASGMDCDAEIGAAGSEALPPDAAGRTTTAQVTATGLRMRQVSGWAARTPGGPLEPWDFGRRELRGTDVAVRIRYCGVCASDLSALHHHDPGALPLVPGHEIVGAKSLAGAGSGGVAETRDMLDFCGRHGITAETEILPAHEVNTALDRLARNDVRYRFVLDMSS